MRVSRAKVYGLNGLFFPDAKVGLYFAWITVGTQESPFRHVFGII